MKIVLAVIVLCFVGMIVANIMKGIATGKYIAGLPETAQPVTAMKIEGTAWTPVIKTAGLVRPNQGAMLSSQMPGTVAKILVQSGQIVKKGDVLVELDNSVEMANLESAQARLPSVKQAYQRYQALYKTKSISRQELDNAKATYDTLTANIDSLKAQIKRRQIIAPFDGMAGIVKVNIGQYVTVGTEIVRVEDRTQMKIDFSLSQNLLEKLHIGQTIIATIDANKSETFNAKITAIEPAINVTTGLVDLQATFEGSAAQQLLSGMFTRLNIALPTENNQIVVPQVAISYNMYGEIAYVLTALSSEEKETLLNNDHFPHKEHIDNVYRANQITVFTKDRQGIYAQLQPKGIKLGDLIVTGGQQNLSNGSLVIVTDKQGVGTTTPKLKSNL